MRISCSRSMGRIVEVGSRLIRGKLQRERRLIPLRSIIPILGLGGCVYPARPGRRGTLRAGAEARVSPSGLASCRSSAVKASINSGASKARFATADRDLCQHPGCHKPVDCLAGRLERPSDEFRPCCGREHWRGRQRSDEQADRGVATRGPDALAPGHLETPHLRLETAGVLHCSVTGRGEERDPAVEPRVRLSGVGRVCIARLRQAAHIVL